MGLIKNIRNRGLKDILNPRRWVMFLRSKKVAVKSIKKGISNALKDEYSEIFNDDNLLEQSVHRMSNLNCRPCLLRGECTHCGCKTPDLFFEKTMECSGMNWFSMVDPENWQEHKKEYNIEVNPDYIAQVKEHGKIIKF